MSYKMTASGRESSGFTRTKSPSHVLLTAALLSEVICGGHAFLMPVGLTSLKRIPSKGHPGESSQTCDDEINFRSSHRHGKKPLFAAQYYNDEDQWGDDAEIAYEQEADTNGMAFQQYEQWNNESAKRAILGGAALGTVMAVNSAVGMSAGAETATPAVPASSAGISEQSVESYSTAMYSAPDVSLPYLEEQIKAAEDAYVDRASQVPQTTTTVATAQTSEANVAATSTSETTAAFSPSFIRYTQEHMPGWIETGHKIYDAAAPKIVAGGQKIVAEVDKRVTPMVIEKEHELLGDENSAILDKTLSNVASAGKMVAGMLGKAIVFGIEGGVQVAKHTPEVIAAAQEMYKTVDEKIVPEVVDTSMKIKTIADKTIPEVMDTGKHAYDTIMPEFVSAEKQIENTVKTGVDMAMPTIQAIEDMVMPELSKMERGILGEERAVMLDKAVADATHQGQDAFQAVEKAIPQVWASGQKTVDDVVYTGRTVAKAVPLVVETGKQAYNSVDRGISDAISTTQDIASDIDRAAGKTVYAIEDNLNGVTGTIDKTIPVLLEAGRQAAESGAEIAKGTKALYDDVSGFVDDVKTDTTINSAAKRFADTKPVYQDYTASVNDPNRLGNL